MREDVLKVGIGFCVILLCGMAIMEGCQKAPDSPTEERLEMIIERVLERQLQLPDESLEGLVDLSPLSPEEHPNPD